MLVSDEEFRVAKEDLQLKWKLLSKYDPLITFVSRQRKKGCDVTSHNSA